MFALYQLIQRRKQLSVYSSIEIKDIFFLTYINVTYYKLTRSYACLKLPSCAEKLTRNSHCYIRNIPKRNRQFKKHKHFIRNRAKETASFISNQMAFKIYVRP